MDEAGNRLLVYPSPLQPCDGFAAVDLMRSVGRIVPHCCGWNPKRMVNGRGEIFWFDRLFCRIRSLGIGFSNYIPASYTATSKEDRLHGPPMSKLALETDSTRAITLLLDSVNSPTIEVQGADIQEGYHNLSHHGKNEKKLQQLEAIDQWHMRLLDELFTNMKSVKEGNETLLDRTMIVYGSNLGNANTHVTTNLPVLFAGGGFQHGQHLAYDTQDNYPLPNLFVSMLQRMGLEVDRFATSTGTMRGLGTV